MFPDENDNDMKYKFKVTRAWSSSDCAKSSGGFVEVNPMSHNFKAVEEEYLIDFLDESRVKVTGSNGYVTEGTLGNQGRPGYYDRTKTPVQEYRMHYSLGGRLSIYKDGMAELASFGSGLPVISIDYGHLESVGSKSHYCCQGGLVFTTV